MRLSAPSEAGARLAFVIPWFGPEARGGAELQGWETARAMARRGYAAEVLTTCSRSFMHPWEENHFAPGLETVDGVPVRRFKVDGRRANLFGAVNQSLLDGVRLSPEQEDVFLRHNINSADMRRFIAERGDEYVFVFLPYLYGTTLGGAAVRPDRSLLMPCFHDEPYGYLEAVRRIFGGVRGMLYLTPEEGSAVERAMGATIPGRVVGGGIDTALTGSGERFRRATGVEDPYLLYVGRLDRGKNTHLLMDYFRHWAGRRGGAERLLLLGGGSLPVPAEEKRFLRLGVMDEQGKMDACAAAAALCQPSVNESFSRVIMEAWLNEVPVVVHAGCDVTREHCRRSGGGLYFKDYFEFAEIMDLLFGDEGTGRKLGAAGRRYVLATCHWDAVCRRLAGAVEDLTGARLSRRAEAREAP